MKVTDVGLAVIVGPCAVPVMGTVTLLAPVPVVVSTRLAVDVPPAVGAHVTVTVRDAEPLLLVMVVGDTL